MIPSGVVIGGLLVPTLVLAATDNPLDISGIFSGGLGAAAVAALIFVIRIIADRAIPSRSDARASTALVMTTLNNMVKILQEEKQADGERLLVKQRRIDELEAESDRDYGKIRELRDEILDLQTSLARRDRHITLLVSELRKVGRQVTGLDLEDIEITHPSDEAQRIRDLNGMANEESSPPPGAPAPLS